MTQTVGSTIARWLHARGVEVVFGIPGVNTLELFRGLGEVGLRHVLTRHEQGAVFAADGYARVSGRPGVVFSIDGPGLTNAATAVAQAHHDSIPILILSAGPPRGKPTAGTRLHAMRDQQVFMRSIVASTTRVEGVDELSDALDAAFAAFASGTLWPVHVEVPVDLLQESGELPSPASWQPPSAPAPDARRVEEASRLLQAAKQPVILLGGGAQDAGTEAVALAERTGALVVNTLNGKGAVPENHPLHLGTTLPVEAVLTAVEAADVVVAVGTQFCDVDYYYAQRSPHLQSVIKIDVDGEAATRSPSAEVMALIGDASACLELLKAALSPAPPADLTAATRRAADVRAAIRWWPLAERLRPAIEAVAAALPPEAVVAVDSTQLGYAGQHMWPARHSRSWLIPAGWGTLGPSLPMAIGAAVGAPGRPVVCVCGDGGLLFTVGELATAHALELPIVLLIWDNGGYAEMRDEMDLAGIELIGTDGGLHDPARMLEGFGWSVASVDTAPALSEAIAAGISSKRPAAVVAAANKICP